MRSRHDAQSRFTAFGAAAQERLSQASVTVLGVGALGCASADMLARAGVARLRLIDRDFVELSNLHRQCLFTERDAEQARPKVIAAAERLKALSSGLEVDTFIEDFDGENALELLAGTDLVLDGTDNFEARQLLNEACLELGQAWIHASCLGSQALAWAILPGQGACHACLVPEVPEAGEGGTCSSEGILPPAVQLAAAFQVAEAMKLLGGRESSLLDGPIHVDAWTGRSGRVRAERNPDCHACGAGERRLLHQRRPAGALSCGADSVQIRLPRSEGPLDLEGVAGRLPPEIERTCNPYLLRFHAPEGELTLFVDGRVLVGGTRDPARARGLVARYLGG